MTSKVKPAFGQLITALCYLVATLVLLAYALAEFRSGKPLPGVFGILLAALVALPLRPYAQALRHRFVGTGERAGGRP